MRRSDALEATVGVVADNFSSHGGIKCRLIILLSFMYVTNKVFFYILFSLILFLLANLFKFVTIFILHF